MKHATTVTALFFFAGLSVSCTPGDKTSATGDGDRGTMATQRDKTYSETKEAGQALQDYTFAQKSEFVSQMKQELTKIQEEIDRLATKVEKSNNATKADAKSKIEGLSGQWAQTKKQLDRAESATESTWGDVKEGFNRSNRELNESFQTTRQWLREKIAS